jgi:hypothetical protein
MTDKKISQLSNSSTPLSGAETVPIVQSGSTVKVTVDNLTAGKDVPAARFGAGVSPATVFDAAGSTGTNLNLRLSPSGWTIKHRIGAQYTGDGSAWTNNALMTSATTGTLDDTANTGSAVLLSTSGVLSYVTATAGANPRTFIQVFGINPSGDLTASVGNFIFGTATKGLQFPGGLIWRTGTGTPEGAVTAPVGSLFTRTDGGASTTLYVKETGAGNTGWVAK